MLLSFEAQFRAIPSAIVAHKESEQRDFAERNARTGARPKKPRTTPVTDSLEQREKKVLAILKANRTMTRSEIAKATGMTSAVTGRVCRDLIDKNLVISSAVGRGIRQRLEAVK